MKKNTEKNHEFFKLVGGNIASYRKRKKLSMEKLGLEVGLTRAHVHRIENGYNITLLTILKLAIALQVQPDKLLKVDYRLNREELDSLLGNNNKELIKKSKEK